VITLDASAIFALLNGRERHHERVRQALENEQQPFFVPAGILAETAYLVESRLGSRVMDRFLTDLITGGFTIDCGEQDLRRVQELARRYSDLPLGVADATVIACAERNGGLVLTLDERHFRVVEREGRIRVLP
jgi:predicted nucleic acid-binding protein